MKRILLMIILVALVATIQFAEAQNSDIHFTLDEYEMKIDGSANVRDWDADVNTVEATFILSEFEISDLSSLTLEHFKTMELTIPVRDIDSDSGRLTRNLQGYLKRDEHPDITFRLNEVDSITINGDTAEITASGVVNAAGVEHETTMHVTAAINDGKVTFSGSQDLLMTDFDIDPPTAVLGTIRAHDEISIIYSLTFTNQ